MKHKSITLADIALIAVLLITAAAGFVAPLMGSADEGSMVVVRVNGEVRETLPLSVDTTLDIDGHNLLVIEDGCAYMED
ncbi:MAG: NusG domain II-containing protein, partial [Oscillospiraceae bacterium]|nr:NusG domain II-containing protein [Oscillospiraceae bacterium]